MTWLCQVIMTVTAKPMSRFGAPPMTFGTFRLRAMEPF